MISLSHSYAHLIIHPLTFITISYMLGIGLYATNAPWLFHGGLCITILAAYTFAQPLYSRFLLLLLLFISYGAGACRFLYVEHKQHTFQQMVQGKKTDIIGTVIDNCWIDHPLYSYKITLALDKIKPHSTPYWQSSSATVLIYTKKHTLHVADVINLRHTTFSKSTDSSFNRYLLKEGIDSVVFAHKSETILLLRPTYSLKRWIFSIRERVYQQLRSKMDAQTFALFASIFLGSKSFYKSSLEHNKESFTTWGISHYLARSGLHMVIFILLWQWALRYIPLYITYKQFLLMGLIAVYCVLSWSSISYIRAVMSFLLYRVCMLLQLPTNFLHGLTVVCLFILLYNPAQLLFLDFQLSFGLTLALALFYQAQEKSQRNY